MEFIKKMNSEIMYKKLSELEEEKEYEILDYNFKFVESLKKYILNVTINVDGLVCSVGLPDKSRRTFVALSRSEQDEIIGQKLFHQLKIFTDKFGKIVTYYDVKFTQ